MLEDMMQTMRSHPAVASSPGLVTGTVKELYDKNEPGKIKVEYYIGEKGKILTGWVPVMTPYTAAKGGMYMLPEIGTEVVIGFLAGRTDCPVVLGSLYCKSVERPANAVNEKNTVKVLRTKGGHEVRFSEEDKKGLLTIQTPGGLEISMGDEKKVIEVRDKEKKNSLTIDGKNGAIKVDASKKIVLSIGGTAAVTIESNKVTVKSGTIQVTANQSLKLKGQSTAVQGSTVQVKADGSLTAQASGMTQVKGAMVKIN